jgi:hypothetical protein
VWGFLILLFFSLSLCVCFFFLTGLFSFLCLACSSSSVNYYARFNYYTLFNAPFLFSSPSTTNTTTNLGLACHHDHQQLSREKKFSTQEFGQFFSRNGYTSDGKEWEWNGSESGNRDIGMGFGCGVYEVWDNNRQHEGNRTERKEGNSRIRGGKEMGNHGHGVYGRTTTDGKMRIYYLFSLFCSFFLFSFCCVRVLCVDFSVSFFFV